ncbi:hypothetical protein F0L68_39130 [Solihabitans fulvus]|uniref:Lipoprotein n=1 Tax=Solihabitans fulvus TaxID=1892852 RepID=A0A5B2WII8_9PSEU|nr:hypothetical protein [Solihabitans fulvus]KAA2250159.1 hypothetical protein F0L68_39130 [Solihabitans fulvus]
MSRQGIGTRARLAVSGPAVLAAFALAGCGPTNVGGSATGNTAGAGATPTASGAPAETKEPQDTMASTEPGRADGALAGASDASRKAGSVKAAYTMETDDGTQSVTIGSGTGAIDFANHRSTAEMTMGGGESGRPNAKTVTVMDGSTAYLQMAVGGEGGHWIKFDLSKLAGPGGGTDLSNYLDLLAGATDSSQVGSDTVRGTATTHYKVTVDPKKLLDQHPELKAFYDSLSELTKKVAPSASAGSDSALAPKPYDVWIDGSGLVARVQSSMKTKSEGGKDATAKVTVEYYDYGMPVQITVPSVDETPTH